MGELVAKAERKGVKLHLPTDFITGDKFSKDANVSSWRLIAGISTCAQVNACPYSIPDWFGNRGLWHS